jgi:hypothetical protein
MARASVAQRTQVVLESTYGVKPSTPHWYRLPTLAVKPKPENEAMSFREQGRKFPSVVIPNKEWSSATFEGALTYGELPFIYASVFGVTTPADGGTTPDYLTWTIAPSNDTPDTPATYTMQHGDNGPNGIQAGGLTVTDATLSINRTEAKLSGTMIGQQWTTGQTLDVTGTPPNVVVSDVENVPITPGSVSVYLDSTFANIGTTKLTHFLDFQFHVQSRWAPEWVVDSSDTSFLQLVEAEPKATVTIKAEADSTAMGFFATYRAGSIAYVRVKATGTQITTGHNYSMTLDIPVEFSKLNEYSDEGGVYAIGFELEAIADATAGFPMKMVVVNQTAAL